MKNRMMRFNIILAAPFILAACTHQTAHQSEQPSFTQGLAERYHSDVYECRKVDSGGVPPRVTNDGKIISEDGIEWIVPAKVDYEGSTKASDLFNVCNDVIPLSSADVNMADFPVHDAGGSDVFTAYVFGDNYFEFTVNDKITVVDPLPFTPFNSSVIKFKAERPFNLAVKAVDWEEYSGLGMETFGKAKYHAGDGGIVIVIKDASGKIVSVTDDSWKAQTFYIAPLATKSCLVVTGADRNSLGCPMEDVKDGSQHYAAHWPIPQDWKKADFDDSAWSYATEYTNEEISVFNKPAFSNFTDIFDDVKGDASFIWSSNVVLDNIVLLRKTVK